MKKYILTGKPSEVEKVIRENRIRIGRGDIVITPLQDDGVPEGPEVPDEPIADESESKGPEQMDDKNVGLEDMKEVDLDADEKNIPDDSKDVQADDTKETKPAKKTSNRTKNSE